MSPMPEKGKPHSSAKPTTPGKPGTKPAPTPARPGQKPSPKPGFGTKHK